MAAWVSPRAVDTVTAQAVLGKAVSHTLYDVADPWSSGGVHFNASSTVFAIWIEDVSVVGLWAAVSAPHICPVTRPWFPSCLPSPFQGAHHLDLRAANRLDPHSVIVARDFHQQNIAGWIKEFHMQQQQQQQAKNEL